MSWLTFSNSQPTVYVLALIVVGLFLLVATAVAEGRRR